MRRGRRSECGNRRAYREGGRDGGLPEEVSRAPLAWPLDAEALEDLRWYLEDYLPAPFGMWENRGPTVRAKLTGWAGPGRDAYQRARDRGLEVVFRSAEPGLLTLRQAVTEAADAGEPFHVVHFDGHGVIRGGGGAAGARPA